MKKEILIQDIMAFIEKQTNTKWEIKNDRGYEELFSFSDLNHNRDTVQLDAE